MTLAKPVVRHPEKAVRLSLHKATPAQARVSDCRRVGKSCFTCPKAATHARLFLRLFNVIKISIGLSAILSFGTIALGAFPSQAAFTDCLTGTDKASGLISDLPSSCLVGDKRYFDFSTDIAADTFITIAEVGPTGKQHNLILSNAPIGGTFFNYKIEVVGSPNYLLTWQSDAAGAIAPIITQWR